MSSKTKRYDKYPRFKPNDFNFDTIQNEIKGVIEESKFDYYSGFGKTHKLSHHFTTAGQQYLMGQLPIFTKELKMHISNYCTELNYSRTAYQFVNSWMTMFDTGDYAHIHNHNDVDFSGTIPIHKGGIDARSVPHNTGRKLDACRQRRARITST